MATGPSDARLRTGISCVAQKDVNGPTTPIALGLATYCRAFDVHLVESWEVSSRLDSLQTWNATRSVPALYECRSRASVIAFTIGLVRASTPVQSGRSATMSTSGDPAPR